MVQQKHSGCGVRRQGLTEKQRIAQRKGCEVSRLSSTGK